MAIPRGKIGGKLSGKWDQVRTDCSGDETPASCCWLLKLRSKFSHPAWSYAVLDGQQFRK